MTGLSRRSAARGFTLVELLVVIAIIAILGAISFPISKMAIIHANIAKCSSNLHGIGIAMVSFASDNDGCLPESGGTIAYNAVDAAPPGGTGKPGWTQQLEPYVGAGSATEDVSGNSVYQCPDRSLVPNNKYYSYFNGAHAAYAATGTFGPVDLSKIQTPSSYIMAGDIAFSPFTVDDCDKDDYTQDPAFNGYTSTTGGRSPIIIHGGSVNILFADGHVRNVRSFDKTTMTTVYNGVGYDYLATP